MMRLCVMGVVLATTLGCPSRSNDQACERADEGAQWSVAVETCREAWDANGDPQTGFRWARAASRLGDVSVAQELVDVVDDRSVVSARLRYIVAADQQARGELDVAEAGLLVALSILEQHDDAKRAAAVTRRIGRIRRNGGRYAEAAESYEASRAFAQRVEDPTLEYGAVLALAALHRVMGDGARADHWQSEAIALFPDDPTSIGVEADAARRRGRWAVAEALYDRASQGFAERQEWGSQRVVNLKRVELALLREDAEAAREALGEAVVARTKFSKGAPLEELSPNVRSSALFYQASVALEEGDVDAASEAVERARVRPLGATDWDWQFALLEGKLHHANGELRDALASWFAALDTKTVGERLGPFDEQHANRRRREALEMAGVTAFDLEDVEASLAVVDRLYAIDSDDAERMRLTVSLAEAALTGRDALAYVVTNEAVLSLGWIEGAWVLTRIAVGRDELEALTSAFVADPSSNASRELAELLVPPALVQRAGVGSLVIVPDGPLQDMPWAALATDDGFLVEHVDVLLAPSLRAVPWDGRGGEVEPVFITDPQGDLPQARAEGRTWSKRLAGTHHTGLDATREQVRDSNAALLHVAVHGGIAGGEPWISLADGRLTASEIALGGGVAGTVVLTTCASTTTRSGDVWTSIPGAFIKGGSKHVVGTLGSVNDEVAERFADALYAHGGRQLEANAVSQAQRDLLTEGRPPQEWAPFVSMGFPSPRTQVTP